MSLLPNQLSKQLCLGKQCWLDPLLSALMASHLPCRKHLLVPSSPLILVIMVGISQTIGWVATLKDGRVRLQDDLNPVASYTDPKRISLLPLLTLPYCQTQIVTNVSMFSSSPQEETVLWLSSSWDLNSAFADRLLKATPSGSTSGSQTHAFFEGDGMFRIPESGGKTTKSMLGMPKMKTEALMVFKLDEERNAVYTEEIGDLVIFLSRAEPFCVPASSFPGMYRNRVKIFDDDDETGTANLAKGTVSTGNSTYNAHYYIPPQYIEH